ncbi:MAG: CCA tRNA nucleotidyltransferase [Candidatus Sumerlaeaceae bacterium]|nr:CCA tRNA nucleotidyltransferase [Candidatus Sumerlaeaceae bacterium]
MGQWNFDTPAAQASLAVVQKLRKGGYDALLVGGCVRDMILGHDPGDFDVATNARPDAIASLFPHTFPVGAKFGVMLVLDGEQKTEVATFRSDGAYRDHRHPDSVVFSNAENDAQRRDFTVNGLFYDTEARDVVDFVGGVADIEKRVIRCIGNPGDRFNEDALRLLRAARFASSLGFEVEPETLSAIQKLVHTIVSISAERVREELIKGLTRANPDRFIRLLDQMGLLEIILPEVAKCKGVEQPPAFHPEGDVYVHTLLMLGLLPPNPSLELAFATLLHDIGKPPTMTITDRIRFNQHQQVGAQMADVICRRLAFSNDQREAIVAMVDRHMDFMNIKRMRESTLRRFLAAPTIDDEVALHRVDCLGSHGDLDNYEFALERLAAIRAEEPAGNLPPPLVTGDDLIALGKKPGPAFRKILTAVQDAQLESRVSNRDEALAMLRNLAEQESVNS